MSATGPAPVPQVLAITPPDGSLDTRFEGWLADLVLAGVDAVQVRRKELSDRALLLLVERTLALLEETSVAVLVNRRVDIAIGARGPGGVAAGVHLPAAGLPTDEVRRLAFRAGRSLLVGRSTHSVAEIGRERSAGADYLTFGPVFATPGKAGFGPPKGLEPPDGLRAACSLAVPVVALGGIEADRAAEAIDAGAAGVAAIRACADRRSAGELVAAVREACGRRGDGAPPVIDSAAP